MKKYTKSDKINRNLLLNTKRRLMWLLLITFTLLGGFFVFKSYALSAPTNLTLLGLDSTIRANWTASKDPDTKHQVVSVWTGDGISKNGSKLISSKVVGATANTADLNGLRTGDTFTVKVQSRDVNDVLSTPATATAKTDQQFPIKNASYFDNFNESMHGTPMNPDYYDVRTWSGYGDTFGIDNSITAFNGERHFHGQVIESQGQGGVMIRTRVPASLVNDDGSPRVITFQTEVDLPPLQSVHGKWFEIHFSQNPAGTHALYGSSGGAKWSNDVSFQMVANSCSGTQRNTASIMVNVNGDEKAYCTNPEQQFSPVNVRVPVVLKVSKTSAEMYINGKKVGQASGFNLPFDSGYWSVIDANYRSGYDGTYDNTYPTVTNHLSHWDMIQFDGPAGSYSPVAKTYIQAGCSGVVVTEYHGIRDCPAVITQGGNQGNATINITNTDDLSKLRSVKLLFNGPHQNPMAISINGQPLVNLPKRVDNIDTQEQLNYYTLTKSQFSLLKAGVNTISFSGSIAGSNNWNVISQVELETIYNIPRTYDNPEQMFMPMLLVTNNDNRIDHLPGQPNIMTGSTWVYASGSDEITNYSVSQINPDASPWFTITSPTSGTVKPLTSGGKLVPINYSIDFSKFTQPSQLGGADSADGMGIPALLKITGGMAPVYASVLAVKDQRDTPITTAQYNMTETVFNKESLPAGTQTNPVPPEQTYKTDLNNDNKVNVFDLSILLSQWSSTTDITADIDKNGIINIFDLSILLAKWS